MVLLDGAMGSLLQEKGLKPGEFPERWNLTHPEVITGIHRDYFDAGSNVVCTNTFGANLLKFSKDELSHIVKAAIENAKKARSESQAPQEKFIALDIGPSGKLLKPLGQLDFEEAVSLFAETVKLGEKFGADLIFIETMNDSYETKAALLAAKESSSLPVLVSNAYGEDGKLMTGATPAAMVALLEGMGADAIGANCSLGPRQLSKVAKELLRYASVPVILKPNAGLPREENGKTIYDITPEEFAQEVSLLIQEGIRVAGGCCGSTPEYISHLNRLSSNLEPVKLTPKNQTAVSSYSHAVFFGSEPILIGERINPTGKKRLKEALYQKDIGHILSEGIRQEEMGVHILDVNVGLPDIDEKTLLCECICRLQEVLDLPLQIDTADPEAMERALRRYNGKALINSVNGKKESMEAIFPLVKKYGGAVIALTLDENGIPSSADGRVEIAKQILKVAESYGIDRKDIIFDTLAMTVSADPSAPLATLGALRTIREELGCHTLLGVSNVSFGLPSRDAINSTFFALALENGLSGAIMNPFSQEMMKTYFCYRALKGQDENFSDYISHADAFLTAAVPTEKKEAEAESESFSQLQKAIEKGWKEKAGELTGKMLEETAPLEIINGQIIPALDAAGKGFEEKRIFLPQLLMSAEAAKFAFEKIREKMGQESRENQKAVLVLATVQGDIHDIGKNIVKLLLENYGYQVLDLGKDVSPDAILKTVLENRAPFVGLSALMTTTVPAMEQTISLLREHAPWCKTLVGGAVLTEEYARKIKADFYAKDAMEAVRYLEKVAK